VQGYNRGPRIDRTAVTSYNRMQPGAPYNGYFLTAWQRSPPKAIPSRRLASRSVRRPGDPRRRPQDLLKTSSGALNSGRAVLPDMRDSYETPADHRPWQARHTDWAALGPRQDHTSQPATPPAEGQAQPPRWSGLGLSQDPVQPPEPSHAPELGPAGWPGADPNPRRFPGDSDPAGLRPLDWAAQDPYPNHQGGRAAREGSLEYRPANWVGHDPFRRHPIVPPQPPYPAHTAQFGPHDWADCDPYTGYPIWPGHAAYAGRNAGLRRLSKLTWRAAEVSAVVAVSFVALFARTAHSATNHVSAQHSAKPAIHAAAAHPARKQHKPKHHHHHHNASTPALAPPAAPPAAPAPPPPPPPAAPAPAPAAPAPAPAAPAPAPPPPPVTTSGGSGGG
jgi:hypothetical protein